ncbi:carbamoyl-phosphate synthase large subunit [Desulfurispirillum indicum]|uniref:Carbamoyl phosphate synthase large chain n=1 Tax=Desulfurispirillum indicum (strain ATCC BAA-1389 / DSM 22839 / S5) TaxID=653733 RepID=E6W5I6_DESIS|nr:carbamoyl-phosphate synthase large subunit [Desulfurispirillum indicum]ADU64917.1 carbamoyl-phosphate synthase, large subunit [Desulfurispirillum indicum S5]UCZ56848.1 carbamoyl-phosphate synthase large subunit [Desulfurispirillum indicum]
MPKRTDIKKILVIGSGPIVIGQACEFDYSGTQAIKALKEEGYEVVLINSNPATIMTDAQMADATYIEPITASVIEKIIEKERPCAILPTVGGQTALNAAVEVAETGILKKYNVEMIGANLKAIQKGEDRELFKEAMNRIGLEMPRCGYAHSLEEARKIVREMGLPAIIRPSFTLGGSGGGIAYNMEEFDEIVASGLDASPSREILIDESIIGWKEYEMEVMRDKNDNVVIICSIENFDPMGVHTGDSITVAPAQTLSDKEYQLMRDATIKVIREIGVDTGGSNVQFAVNPDDGRLVIIEMNPRVSRSSALASKATGFPIAKIAAKLAVGYTLDEIPNDITKETPASFEPTIDYVVVKYPRFTFEKFPNANATLTTQMKSVGEAMSIGRTFKESFQKVLRSLEIDSYGFESRLSEEQIKKPNSDTIALIENKLRIPNWERVWYIGDAFRIGFTIERIHQITNIDPWFLEELRQIVEMDERIAHLGSYRDLNTDLLRQIKEMGFSDRRIAQLTSTDEQSIERLRKDQGVVPVFKRIDTCGAEFEAQTPYLYSTYEEECEAAPTDRKKIMIIGGGPNRIGQGIEFDYCCCHAAFALSEDGFETIMVNCNPETVSTDYDTSDRLYFEPVTREDILSIVEKEKPHGLIIQFGGQTPLKLAVALEKANVPILGTSPDAIDRAEDRERFKKLVEKLELKQPANATATSEAQALEIAERIGYPVVVRPSYVLGGRAMEIVYNVDALKNYMEKAVKASPEHPVLIDHFLEHATEVDVDAVCDGENVIVAGIMEHIEEAGIHSGDSACSLPPKSLSAEICEEIRRQTRLLALELKVVGLMNIQFAIKGGEIYLIEVNPRASRTVPFVSKATGIPFAKIAALVMAGRKLPELGLTRDVEPEYFSVKESVFPFIKFPGVDTILGPEMRSTGEVMGIDPEFGIAFAKAQSGAGGTLPLKGTVFISVRNEDKEHIPDIARKLIALGFKVVATRGTAAYLKSKGIEATPVHKVNEGRPNIVDLIVNGSIALVFNTPGGEKTKADALSIRRSVLTYKVPYFTTVEGAKAAVTAIEAEKNDQLHVKPLQEHYLNNAYLKDMPLR